MGRAVKLSAIICVAMFIASSCTSEVPEAGPASTSPVHEVARIQLPGVEGRIDHLAWDKQTGMLYVAALGNNSVEVIDTRAKKVVHSIKGLAEPQGVRVAAGRLYVASAKDGTCRIFDASFTPLEKLELGDDADNVRFDAAANRIYVGYGSGALAAIDIASLKKVADIKLPAHPESFQLEEKGRRIFINLPEANASIAVVDRDKGAIVETWKVPGATANFPMALDEADARLFVGCRRPARLEVIDTRSGKPVAELDCVADTDDVWYDPSARRIYISGGGGAVTVLRQLDADHYVPEAQIPTAPGARTSLLAPDGVLYVAVPRRPGQPAQVRAFAR